MTGTAGNRDAWVAVVHLDVDFDHPDGEAGAALSAVLHGTELLTRTVQTLQAAARQCVVCLPERLTESARRLVGPDVEVAAVSGDRGGAVLDVMSPLPATVTGVLVHDAERPLVCPDVLAAVCSAVASGAAAALPVLDVPDTIKRVDHAGRVIATMDRGRFRRAQTPQAFVRTVLESVLGQARDADRRVPDVAAAVAAAGVPVQFVPGDERLLRIRSSADLAIAEALMSTNVLRSG